MKASVKSVFNTSIELRKECDRVFEELLDDLNNLTCLFDNCNTFSDGMTLARSCIGLTSLARSAVRVCILDYIDHLENKLETLKKETENE